MSRAQIAAVEQRLKDYSCLDVEVHTVDRFQGRDKRVIILSLVRSNASSDVRLYCTPARHMILKP